jgi:curved DNA-binding protein CbpA
LKTGSIVYVRAKDGSIEGSYEVVYCARRGVNFRVGLEIREEVEETTTPARQALPSCEPDHYETLQINPKADVQTIHRVFRMMAARFHPDNPETGDVERFLEMKRAYAVLSDPERRAEYDSQLETNRGDGPRPIFGLKDFVTGIEAEGNRRLGVCCLLYRRRQTNPDAPGVSLLDLEREMGFPREYLSFTMWYLRAKDFVTVADNSDYALTAAGAEFVESKAVRHEIVARLLSPAMRVPRSPNSRSRGNSPVPPSRGLLTS